METKDSRRAVIAGSGPAGLTAAYELCGRNVPAVVLERDRMVGGIARTEEYRGYRFDIGGHRFFSQIREVNRLWEEVMGAHFMRVRRLSRVYDDGYQVRLAAIEQYLKTLSNLQMIGRNGLHKYNNQDHSMLTGMLAVENLFGAGHDIWRCNSDQNYQEESR
jgi:protoporphyrinogen oxidase